MVEWLRDVLMSSSLSEEAEGYLMGRGLQESRIRDLGVIQWDSRRCSGKAPDEVFRKEHGDYGERWNNRVVIPLWGPTGALLGVEARVWNGPKKLSQYLLPEAKWNPVFVGLTPNAMQKIWNGGSVWIEEGVFDMGAMEHGIPPQDVALATLRARVSENHALFLHRFCRGWVNVVFDNDKTGRDQTHGYVDSETGKRRWGALEVLGRVGVKVRDVPYRGGKDPGEIWERAGTQGLQRAFAGAL